MVREIGSNTQIASYLCARNSVPKIVGGLDDIDDGKKYGKSNSKSSVIDSFDSRDSSFSYLSTATITKNNSDTSKQYPTTIRRRIRNCVQ